MLVPVLRARYSQGMTNTTTTNLLEPEAGWDTSHEAKFYDAMNTATRSPWVEMCWAIENTISATLMDTWYGQGFTAAMNMALINEGL